MPTVHVDDRAIQCEQGATLRRVLLDAHVSPYRGIDRLLNCHGMGMCGKCALEVHGDASYPSLFERIRLWLNGRRGFRLACKVRVIGDVYINAERLRAKRDLH